MAALVPILGDSVQGKTSTPVNVAQDLDKKIIALYFSAHWCPPCRAFTPILIEAYNAAQSKGLPFDLVFVSSDSDQKSFDSYYGTHPWKAIPFSNEEARQSAGEKFGVTGIPMLVVLNSDGSVVSSEGRREITANKVGAIETWCKALKNKP